MKKIIKRLLLGFGVVILTIVILFVGYGIKAKSEMKIMAPAETMKIADNIFSIKDSFVNLYLVKDSNVYIAIDAGNNSDVVSGELEKLNIDPDKVTAVLLTHTDGDHVASIKLFQNAKIYLSKQEEKLINGEKSRFLFFGNKIDANEHLVIDDLEILNIGDLKIKGILTPGHTIGSMCYLVNDQYLFTGDILSLKDGKMDRFNGFFNMDTETAFQSMKKITELPEAKYIFTAHYGYCDNYTNAVKDWGK